MLNVLLLTVALVGQVAYLLCAPAPARSRDYAIAPADVVCVDGTCTVRPLGVDGKRSVVVARGVTPPAEPVTVTRRVTMPAVRPSVVRLQPSSGYYYLPPSLYPGSRAMQGGSYSYSTCPSCR